VATNPTSIAPLPLRSGVHVASCPDGFVVLDIPGDTYLSLYMRRGDPAGTEADLRAALGGAGLLDVPATTKAPLPLALRRVWQDMAVSAPTRAPIAFLASFGLALGQALLRWRSRRFADLLAWAEHPPAQRNKPAGPDLSQLVAWFEWSLLWLPVRPLCLFRSFLLLLILRRYGLNAQWVFGVSLFPFHAHCWLAIGDMLVGEQTDRADEFMPIFATRMAPA
jgi:hypothetical protein